MWYRRLLTVFVLWGSVTHVMAQLLPFKDSASALYGYKDLLGQVVVVPQYAMANAFVEGMASVNKGAVVTAVNANGGKWGFIDTTGKEVIPLQYDFVRDFRKDTARVIKDHKRFIIDKTGKILDPVKVYTVTRFDTPIDWEKKQ